MSTIKKKKSSSKKTVKTHLSSQLKEYATTLLDIKKQIQESQVKAMLAANSELIKLYWSIGKIIAEKQKTSGWGTSVIERLAQDLQNSFPGLSGFSRSNLFNMKAFYLAYEFVQQPAGQIEEFPFFRIPWWHNVILLEKLKDNNQRLWYAQKTIDHGWSRNILAMQIEAGLHKRQGKAITNFHKTLPASTSDMAQLM